MIVIFNRLYEGEALLGRFSSHAAAFQAMQRLRCPDWRPLQEAFTPEDWAEFRQIGEVPA